MRRVAALIAKADALLITAGAGMGVDSDLPDFRSPQGLRQAYPPLGQLGMSFEQMVAWVDAVRREQQIHYEGWLARVRGRRLVVIECGAGTSSASVRRVNERVAERSRSTLVRINPGATDADEPTFVLRLPAQPALTMIHEALPQDFRRRFVRAGEADEVPAAAAESDVPTPWAGKPIRLDIGAVTLVDLGLGLAAPSHPDGIGWDDQTACLKRCIEAQRDWAPLPSVRGCTVPGFTMRVMNFRSDDATPRGAAGAALVIFQGAEEYAVVTFGVARLASEGPFLWRLLYETATRALAALEYPRLSWIALRPDAGAAKHAAVMPVLAEIGRVIAWGWLRYQELMEAR